MSEMSWSGRIHWLFGSEPGSNDRLVARWIVLRALGLIYFSAFFSLVFQIRGLIGPKGILPAGDYLQAAASSFGPGSRIWFAPTLLWFSSGSHMLLAICWIGMAAALLTAFNLWPRAMLLICFVCFLSFVAAAQDFSGYQSDGMLLEAGFIALFFAPPGLRPGMAADNPPSRASLFLLQWEWFRIYFESGLVKLLSGDQQWRSLTAMDEYYQNGPLPTWIGWYVQHLPHWFQASTALATLVLELAIAWMLFLPRRWRIVCFCIVTPWEIGVILTANYTFLNYLVLMLGFLLLDDRFFAKWIPSLEGRVKQGALKGVAAAEGQAGAGEIAAEPDPARAKTALPFRHRKPYATVGLAFSSICLTWVFYDTAAELLRMVGVPAPTPPIVALDPFRIANQYGLFAVMTHGRYEIEFQGSRDGKTWIAYPFRFKPQDLSVAPGIYAPYQPRFEWNLWFASLGSWQQNPMVPRTEVLLMDDDPDVLALFAGNPFSGSPPLQVRAVLWQYWFTTMAEKRATGRWWRRDLLGLYAPSLERQPDGKLAISEMPGDLREHD